MGLSVDGDLPGGYQKLDQGWLPWSACCALLDATRHEMLFFCWWEQRIVTNRLKDPSARTDDVCTTKVLGRCREHSFELLPVCDICLLENGTS